VTAMISAIFGPPRHGLKALVCGWHSEMEQGEYTRQSLEDDLKSLEFVKACGLNGITESHPWSGETDKMNALREGDVYCLGPEVKRFMERAKELELTVVQWPTMNNTHPWNSKGRPFRQDKPEWLRGVLGQELGEINRVWDIENYKKRIANCLACKPFYKWLEEIIRKAMDTDYFAGWCMDGDFWGGGAFYNTTIPVTCFAKGHDHLPGDSNYTCQRQLNNLIGMIRREYPHTYIAMCRPSMDLGIWSNRNVDACFTLIETGTGSCNISAGNEIRTASRIRTHHHFFPHWLDWSLLFPSYADPVNLPLWPSENIDFIMLSALSCTPNLLFFLPTKTGIPERNKVELKKWLEWGRKNEKFLMVRKDLFDWPASDRVDGSVHIVGKEGLIFLFNPSQSEQIAKVPLTDEEIGWHHKGSVAVCQEYPVDISRHHLYRSGETIQWQIPPRTAVVLHLLKSSPV
ncbi:MAG: hypothetical protein Q7J78_04655, partial [Clostridiales bacterium]|nr:hypothetical protein [Clostridiales bacterium]